MKLAALAASTLALSGCDLVFSITPADPIVVDGSIDSSTLPRVHGTWQRMQLVDTVAGGPVVETPPPTDVTYQAVTADGESRRVEVDATTGAFSFEVPTAGARYWLTRRDRFDTIELQSDASELRVVLRGAGRLDRDPGVGAPTITFPGTGDSTATARVISTGVFTETYRTTNMPTQAEWRFPWAAAVSLSGPLGRLSSDAGDVLGYGVFSTISGTTIEHLTRFRTYQVDVGGASETQVTDPPLPLTGGACIAIVPHSNVELARISAVVGGLDRLFGDLRVHAVYEPGTLGTTAAFTLATQDVPAAADGKPTTFLQANPFAGTTPLGSIGAGGVRTYQYPGHASAAVAYGLVGTRHYHSLDTGACAPTTIDGGLELPLNLAVGGVAVTAGVTVPRGDALRIEATWDVSGSAPASFFSVGLFELQVKVVGSVEQTVLTPLATWITDEPHVSLPSALLVPDHYYVLALTAASGFPEAAAGDYQIVDVDRLAQAIAYQPYFLVGD